MEDIRIIKTILHIDLNSDSSSINGLYTPLQYASKKGNIELVRILTNAKANVNPLLKKGWCSTSSLQFAVTTKKGARKSFSHYESKN